MWFFTKSLAGAGYVVLNVIRAMNITALLSVMAASSVMLVKTFIVSKFFFFDACEHIIRIIMSGKFSFTGPQIHLSYGARVSHPHRTVPIQILRLSQLATLQ